jgi:hypothetical protein
MRSALNSSPVSRQIGSGFEGVVERFLAFLQILVVGQRQPFGHGQQRNHVAQQARRLGSQQLGDVRVAFLWHERAARAVALAQAHEAELSRRPQHQLLAQTREMHAQQRAGKGQLGAEVTVGNRVQAVVRGRTKPQRGRRHLALDGQ